MDKFYSAMLTQSVSGTLTVPPSCLMFNGIATCSELEAMLGGTTAADGGTSATCAASASACDCSVKATQTTNSMGTYTSSGTTVTETPNAAAAQPSSSTFCVQGNMLHLIVRGTSGMSTTEIVATKQ
jgi:hypothetical protein